MHSLKTKKKLFFIIRISNYLVDKWCNRFLHTVAEIAGKTISNIFYH